MMADAIDFMVDRLESLGQSELASRLTLNCQNSYVEPHKIRDIPVTIMDVFDQSALSTEAKEEMYKLYPNARRAHLKTGGNFPYLCRSAEVNLYVQIHLLQFHGTNTRPLTRQWSVLRNLRCRRATSASVRRSNSWGC